MKNKYALNRLAKPPPKSRVAWTQARPKGPYSPLSSPYLGVRSPQAKPRVPKDPPLPPKSQWKRSARGGIVTAYDPRYGRRVPVRKKGKGPVGQLANTVRGLLP